MIQSRSFGTRLRIALTYFIIICMGLACLLPLINMVAISFSSSTAVASGKVFLFPVELNIAAYEKLLTDTQFWRSFGISVMRVILGFIVNMTLTVLLAYPLSKPKKDFRARNIVMGFTVFAMLFSGGMIPIYMVVRKLNLLNTIWSLVLPGAVPIFSVILLMNFFIGVPSSLDEAARIDGANPLKILLKVYLPISKPALATIALFSVVGHWSDFSQGIIYITKIEDYPLQTYIQSLYIDLQKLIQSGDHNALTNALKVSNQNLNAAKIVVSVVPLMAIYPFMQKYFISGIVVGSVKE